jgi:hypothetical protein
MFGELGIPTWLLMAGLIAAPIIAAILGLYRSRRSG